MSIVRFPAQLRRRRPIFSRRRRWRRAVGIVAWAVAFAVVGVLLVSTVMNAAPSPAPAHPPDGRSPSTTPQR